MSLEDPMSPHETSASAAQGSTAAASVGPRPISRNEIVDATARVVARRSDHCMRWPSIAQEAGTELAMLAASWFQDPSELIDACYARTADALADSLLCAETAPGTALDKLAAFLVAALEIRRERGTLLSFRRGRDLPSSLQRRLHERDQMVRTRLKRLLGNGRRDGSLALRNLDSACELILAALQAPDVATHDPEQRMWDSELVELLLAALAEPHPAEPLSRKSVANAHGACLCGTVQYEIDGPFDVMSHCRCSMCRQKQGAASTAFVTVSLAAFRWVSGEEAVCTYQSAAHGARAFCRHCGSVTPLVEADTGLAICPASSVEGHLSAASGRGVPEF
jgi:hypothetical protein